MIVALAAAPAAALVAPVAPAACARRQRTRVQESFGFDFAEDQAENTADGILGEVLLTMMSQLSTRRA